MRTADEEDERETDQLLRDADDQGFFDVSDPRLICRSQSGALSARRLTFRDRSRSKGSARLFFNAIFSRRRRR